jgi:ribokinase
MNTKQEAPNILVFGGINMGLITRAARLPKPGETLRGERFFNSSGGKGATQAVAAARLGARVKMIGRVGDDLFGPALLAALRRDHIDISDVAVDPDHATGVGVIIIDANGQNHVLATYGANLQCGDDQLHVVEQSLDQADILMLQMEIPFEVSIKAAQRAKERGIRTILDPAPAAQIPLATYPHLDIIAPNQTEAEFHTGIKVIDPDSARKAAQILLERGAATAIIKMAELGVYFSTGQSDGFIPPFYVEVVDTTSAGDAFHGALATALAEGKSLEDAVHFGAAAGALAVTKLGVQDAIPTRAEVESLLTGSSI